MMRHVLILLSFLCLTRIGWADGVMVRQIETRAADLVSSPKQEALLITDGNQVVVTLRTHFRAGPKEVAWIIPVPSRPTHVAPGRDEVFTALANVTTPQFAIMETSPSRFGCGCSAAGPIRSETTTVKVESVGVAGIFDYAVLTATQPDDLVAWLTSHQFTVPPGVTESLTPYTQAGWHFLAVRLRPEASNSDTIAPHPISYTYTSRELVFPLIISKPSAAAENEIILYILANQRYGAINWFNTVLMDDHHLAIDPSAPSGTTYEQKFRRLSASGSRVFVTEFAQRIDTVEFRRLHDELQVSYPGPLPTTREMPPVNYLTRLRALVKPVQMDRDVILEPGPSVEPVPNLHMVGRPTSAAIMPTSLLRTAKSITVG